MISVQTLVLIEKFQDFNFELMPLIKLNKINWSEKLLIFFLFLNLTHLLIYAKLQLNHYLF